MVVSHAEAGHRSQAARSLRPVTWYMRRRKLSEEMAPRYASMSRLE